MSSVYELNVYEPFTYERVARSIMCLGIELTILNQRQNLATATSERKGVFFYADEGIPTPRPLTILAWGSLCSLFPIHGVHLGEGTVMAPRLKDSHFLIPFMPALLSGDPSEDGLSPISNLHTRNPESNRPIHGYPHLGSPRESGAIEIEMIRSADEMVDNFRYESMHDIHAIPLTALISRVYPVPPLWADLNQGWQYGMIQHSSVSGWRLRDPMQMLARHGIPLLNRHVHAKLWPGAFINRLMFRFLSPNAIRVWASEYNRCAQLLHNVEYHSVIESDADKLRTQLANLNEIEEERETTSRIKRKSRQRAFAEVMKDVKFF